MIFLLGWGIALGDTVLDGEISLGTHDNPVLFYLPPGKVSSQTLPAFMTENQLDRYGKLPEYNIRNVFIMKQLPTCPEREFLLHQLASLALVQKLLSVGRGGDGPPCQDRTAEHPLRHRR